ncbi:MAG: apolipoprotein N-acyltransferase [Chthoniobacterales bacterium]|nr:apolipoprotein N-acyltransferase [Chthoniobacterales bacterium]
MNLRATALRVWPWLAAIASGLIYRACFAPFDQAWLCWVALVPLLAAVWFSDFTIARRRWIADLLLGYVAGLAFFWSVFSWLTTVTVPGWILVAIYMAHYFAAWAWLCGRLKPLPHEKKISGLEAVTQRLEREREARRMAALPRPVQLGKIADSGGEYLDQPIDPALKNSPWLSSLRNLRLAFLVASAWVTVELLRGTVFSGWGWNTLGHALHAQWALIQIAEFTGVPGLSFLVAFTNVIVIATIRRFIVETKVKPVRPHYDFTITMTAIVAVLGFGVRAVQMRPETTPVRIAAVQPNIPREQKFNEEFAEITFEQFTRLSQVGLRSQPDLIVWPESSMPHPMLPQQRSYEFVMDFAAAAKVDLLLGAIDEDENAAYNAALLVSEGGNRTQLYRKMHLVPFGEYIPGRRIIPGLARIVGDQVPSDFGYGVEHTVFTTSRSDVRVAPLICFEDTIGELTRQFVRSGANLLANVTNDGWFLRSAGSQQHLANAVFRCVETRLPMVRAANTGVTCFINRYGRITQVLLDDTGSQFTEGVLTGEVAVPVAYEPTFYVRYGELFAHVCAAVTAATLAFVVLRFRRRRNADA